MNAGPNAPQPLGFAPVCPFCGVAAAPPRCSTCGRDPSAQRRICTRCQRQTPSAERLCLHCRMPAANEMVWKIPVIILLFAIAFAISIAVAASR